MDHKPYPIRHIIITDFSRNYGIPGVLVLVLSLFLCPQTFAQKSNVATQRHTVHVALPKGDRMKDHASIVAAFERAQPGDTILFAHGMYVVGDIIQVPTPRLTLLGDAKGTVLRGCTPDDYKKLAQQEQKLHKKVIFDHGTPLLPPDARVHEEELVKHCGMFRLTGGRHCMQADIRLHAPRPGAWL